MIVFIHTTQSQDILNGLEQERIWKYCLRREPLQKFIKEQYGKLATLKPDIFIIDLKAFDSPDDLPVLIQNFPAAQYLILVPAGQKFRMQHCISFTESEVLVQYLKEGPKHQKIGIITNETTDATTLIAFQLISCLSEEHTNLCYIEVEKEPKLPERAKKYRLVKTDVGYEYRSIPFYSNLAKDTEIAIFDFGCRDAAKENMIKKCDIALIVKSEKKNKIRIHRGDIDIAIKVPKDPFRPIHSETFQNLIPEVDFGVTEKKPKKIKREKPQKQKKEKVKKEKTINKMPVFRKKKVKTQKAEKSKKKLEWKLPRIPRLNLEFKGWLTKRRLLFIILFFAVLSISAASIRIYSAQKKEEKVKEAVQKKQQEQDPDSTVQFSSEKSAEKSTKEKKDRERPKETTETSVSKASSSYQTNYESTRKTTRQTDSRRTNKKPVTTTRKKKPAATTRKKKPATTTRKPKPTTTRKPKPTTTERFDINYGPE